MRQKLAGIGAGVVAVLGGGAVAFATGGSPAPPTQAAPSTSTPPAPALGPPSPRALDAAGERSHQREHPMKPVTKRPVKAKKPPKKVDKAKAKKVREQVATGADTPKAHLVRAYRKAPSFAPAGCHVTPELLAAIGQVESGNIGGRDVVDHAVVPAIYGPPLTGGAFARIGDSDGGRLDGSSAYDRAVGPMQFIPTTWAAWGTDADGDGRADPQNVYDAAASAARYLCAGGRDLSSPGSLRAAILSYNYSGEYVATVLSWRSFFEENGLEAIGDTSRYVPNGTVTSVTESREKGAKDPAPTPGPKDVAPKQPTPATTPGAAPRPASVPPKKPGSGPRPSGEPTTDPTTQPSPRPEDTTPPSEPPPGTSTSPEPTTPEPEPTTPEETTPSSEPVPAPTGATTTTTEGASSTTAP